jgi:hypothetical protein
MYGFCYLLPFDLWTFYLTRILFLQWCNILFWEFPSSTRIFNGLQHNLQVWQWFINVPKSFSYKDSLFILAIQGKKSWWYLKTYWLAYFEEFLNPTRKVKGKLKEGNKSFHVLRGLFKTTINYPRQTRKLKGRLTSTINFLAFWISKGGNKYPSVSKMWISFMTLFKLGKRSWHYLN